MDLPDDMILVSRLHNDDAEAYEILYHRYKPRIYAFAMQIMPSVSDAEEVVQNVLMAVWNQRKNLQVTVTFQAYLFGIARHKVYEIIKQRLCHQAFVSYFLEQNKEYAFVTEEEVHYNQLLDQLQRLLDELPERRREIFLLSRKEGLTYSEIANRLGITENTVDSQIRHALDYLRGKLLK